MGMVLRAIFVYVFLLILTRISGKRTLAEVTTFDFVLLLVISETMDVALMSDEFSVTSSAIMATSMIFVSVLLSLIEQKFDKLKKWTDGRPVIILSDGRPFHERLKRNRVDEYDILESARRLQGLERLDQIKYAVLEKDGGITIIPRESEK